MSLTAAPKETRPRVTNPYHRDSIPTARVEPVTQLKTPLIQRKFGCACGGSCPKCQAQALNIQTKLTIGKANDLYEQEADRVADKVMRIPEPGIQREVDEEEELIQAKSLANSITPLVQRQVTDEEEDSVLQRKTNESTTTPAVTSDVAERINSLQGRGELLSESARSYFEPRFGQQFNQVRIHRDAGSSDVARALSARAFTVGRDIAFGADQYSPETNEGKRLLAHELTHVIQQSGKGKSRKMVSSGKVTKAVNMAPSPLPSVGTRRSKIQLQRDDDESAQAPTRAESERVAWRFHAMATSATSIAGFQTAVASAAATALGAIGADAVVFSISGSAGYMGAGVGTGYEMVYSPRFGWATYLQVGGGVSTPGGSVAFEVGVIWNLRNPRDYRGSFIELAGSYKHYSGSVFISPSSSPSGGIKVGGAIGSNGVSLLYEYYWQLSGISSAVPDIVHRGHYTFNLPPMNHCGRRETFIVQFNTEDALARRIRVKVVNQRINRRTEATFTLGTGETLNPLLLDESDHMALFDVNGDHIPDLRIMIPNFVQLRGAPGLNIDILFRGRRLRRLRFPGVPAGTLRTGRQYYRIFGSDVRPGGPMFVDECGMGVNDRDR